MGQAQSSNGSIAQEMEGMQLEGGSPRPGRAGSSGAPLLMTQRQKQRRNMRSALEQRQEIEQRQRQNRSMSLEPKAAHEVRAIEHRSARYGPRTSAARKSREKELWNPEKAAAQLIGLQLQNPHAAQQSLLGLIGGQQPLVPRPFRKQSGQHYSVDLQDLSVDERRDLSLTGLTPHQISILQKMWERSPESEIAECARNIMSHLLRSNAQMYQFFGLLGLSDREILSSSTFLRQVANFAIVLDFVLTSVQDEAQKASEEDANEGSMIVGSLPRFLHVCLALQCLGAQHARLAWPIEAHHWALFTRCFEDNPPKEVFQNAEGHDLWKIMINFLIIQMRMGYERAMGVESTTTNSTLVGLPPPSPRLGLRNDRRAASHRLQKTSGCSLIGTRANTMTTDGI